MTGCAARSSASRTCATVFVLADHPHLDGRLALDRVDGTNAVILDGRALPLDDLVHAAWPEL